MAADAEVTEEYFNGGVIAADVEYSNSVLYVYVRRRRRLGLVRRGAPIYLLSLLSSSSARTAVYFTKEYLHTNVTELPMNVRIKENGK